MTVVGKSLLEACGKPLLEACRHMLLVSRCWYSLPEACWNDMLLVSAIPESCVCSGTLLVRCNNRSVFCETHATAILRSRSVLYLGHTSSVFFLNFYFSILNISFV